MAMGALVVEGIQVQVFYDAANSDAVGSVLDVVFGDQKAALSSVGCAVRRHHEAGKPTIAFTTRPGVRRPFEVAAGMNVVLHIVTGSIKLSRVDRALNKKIEAGKQGHVIIALPGTMEGDDIEVANLAGATVIQLEEAETLDLATLRREIEAQHQLVTAATASGLPRAIQLAQQKAEAAQADREAEAAEAESMLSVAAGGGSGGSLNAAASPVAQPAGGMAQAVRSALRALGRSQQSTDEHGQVKSA